MKKQLILLEIIVLFFSIIGPVNVSSFALADIDVRSVSIDQTQVNFLSPGTFPLTAKVFNSNGTRLSDIVPSWTSDNPDVATVDGWTGVVATAFNNGTANITASYGGLTSLPSVITVGDSHVDSINIYPQNHILSLPGSGSNTNTLLIADVRDSSNNQLYGVPLYWSSTSPNVATVDPNTGLVTAVAGGTTTIYAFNGIKMSNGFTISVQSTGISIMPEQYGSPEYSYPLGYIQPLEATVYGAISEPLIWTSNNPTVVRVDSTGTRWAQFTVVGSAVPPLNKVIITAKTSVADGSVESNQVYVYAPANSQTTTIHIAPETFTLLVSQTKHSQTKQLIPTVTGGGPGYPPPQCDPCLELN